MQSNDVQYKLNPPCKHQKDSDHSAKFAFPSNYISLLHHYIESPSIPKRNIRYCEKIYLSSIFVILCLILYLSYSQFACAWSLRFRWFRWFRQFRWFQSFIFVSSPSVPVPWTRSRLPSRDLLDPASSFAGSCSPAIPPCPGKVREDMEYQCLFNITVKKKKIVESMNPSASISQYQVCESES